MSAQLIIAFHGIGDPPSHVPPAEHPYWVEPPVFERLVKESYRVATNQGLEVLATFDDGNRSDLDIGAPLLSTLGIPAAFFPCTGRIGHPDYLGHEDLCELVAMGFEVGSHGIDHVAWPSLDEAAANREIRDSKACLEDIVGRPVTSVAIPFGSYNRKVLGQIRRAGYRTAYCSDRGLANADRWLRQRLTLHAGDAEPDVGAAVDRYRSWSFRAVRSAKSLLKRWR